MHGRSMHQSPAPMPRRQTIWLLAGTGEGPPLAQVLLGRGWRLVVSVVTPEAARAFPPHPRLTLRVGPLADAAAAALVLAQLQPRWVVDATHPFAVRISTLLSAVCTELGQPLLTLMRSEPAPLSPNTPSSSRQLELLPDLASLGRLNLSGERLLLAIGSRHLAAALRLSGAAAHFARVLDRPASLQLALAAGLNDGQLACLRPHLQGAGLVERALCRRWRISAVLCRQSGGRAEGLWQALCADLELRLLLLQRPMPPEGGLRLPLQCLLDTLGAP